MSTDKTQELLEQFKQARAAAAQSDPGLVQLWSPDLVIWLCTGMLLFCFASMVLAAWILSRQPVNPGQILRLFGILSIINVAAIVLIAGYGVDQVSPIIGLFGAIAGYLIGKDSTTPTASVPAEDHPK